MKRASLFIACVFLFGTVFLSLMGVVDSAGKAKISAGRTLEGKVVKSTAKYFKIRDNNGKLFRFDVDRNTEFLIGDKSVKTIKAKKGEEVKISYVEEGGKLKAKRVNFPKRVMQQFKPDGK